jgi:ribosomal protein L11 methyltransferase
MSSPADGRRSREHVLEIAFPSSDVALDDLVQSTLFLTSSLGSTAKEGDGRTIVSAWYESAPARDAARAAFEILDVELTSLDRDPIDWLEHYQQSLRAIEIGRRFIVVPEKRLLPPATNRLPIIVPQEQAFGTGSHESTALCLELIEGLPLAGRKGLDAGAGSGILALGMLRLGARRVIAFDIDRDTFAALRDNRRRNGIAAEAMPLYIGGVDALRGGLFDVVSMNILPEVIIRLLPDIVPRLAREATLVVSGVLAKFHDEVVAAASAQGLILAAQLVRGEWWGGALQRRR